MQCGQRVASGDAPRRIAASLEAYLDTANQKWENSWIRFPRRTLSPYAAEVFKQDLGADKRLSSSPLRCDISRFSLLQNKECFVRIPISYLLKLSLAQAVGQPEVPAVIRQTGEKMMGHFLNDNTSPGTHSFYPVSQTPSSSLGKAVADEIQLRYRLTQLLMQYANQCFELKTHGQEAMVYFAPHPPVRQKLLNDLIPDAFYRELFMSPCLSGWAQGETKHSYMILCHEVLSRSQLNALAKLKDAGIIANNLVVLPKISNISLANNGTHLSFGSRKLTRLMADERTAFFPAPPKHAQSPLSRLYPHYKRRIAVLLSISALRRPRRRKHQQISDHVPYRGFESLFLYLFVRPDRI